MSSKAGSEGGSEGCSDKDRIKAHSESGSRDDPRSNPENNPINVSEEALDEIAPKARSEVRSGQDEGESYDESEYNSQDEGGFVMPIKTLATLAQEAVIRSLSKAVDGEEVTARYCCGGRIPAIEPHATTSEVASEKDTKTREEARATDGGEVKVEAQSKSGEISEEGKDPVSNSEVGQATSEAPTATIRWDDPTNHNMTRRLTISSNALLGGNKPLGKFHLNKACGCEGLHQSKFTIDFHPQDYGILDGITQILLPGWKGFLLNNNPEHRGVKVERCRLHVSTALSESKIRMGGKSRVLGQLILKLSPVTNGTQILLVYDLVVTKRVSDGVGSGHFIDPKLSPLYRGVRDMLLEPGFMKNGLGIDIVDRGGTLGYYCRYSYSHTSPEMGQRLPHALQGVDMVFYTVFRSLGLNVQVKPILDSDDLDAIEEERFERECCGNYEDIDDGLAATWPMKEQSGVTWLNTPYSGGKKPRELAVVMEEDSPDYSMPCCYGCRHDHHLDRIHSLVGMLVFVPKLADRNLDN
ncbi:hypothetical protein BKA65DRAFT_533716 [Rhexocercosporidium sp. MPI-PUGE-AT-0058]|nr:hypothetical protein BKA65DRAFT_533716 [Rhexocercosporidium sp. MPI-PUGE-AT-0058]